MRRRTVAAIAVPAVLVLAAGGYLWADVEDRVPGLLTDAALPPSPAPFISPQSVQAGPTSPAPVSELSDPDAPGAAPMPSAAIIQALAQALRDDPRTGTSTNVAVVDLVTGASLADLDASQGQVPASTTKVMTTLAALHTLGPGFTMTTEVRYDPVRGELALVAGGDMMLAADKGGGADGGRANGWAGLGDLADQAAAALATAGVTTVRVVFDDSAYPAPSIPTEWPSYVVPRGFGAPVTGLAVDIGRQTADGYAQRWPDPSANAAQVFAARMTERGISTSVGGFRSGAQGDVVASVESAPLWLVVEHTLYESDNTIAELLGRELSRQRGGIASETGAASAITASLTEFGIDTTGLEIYDGAGYSTRNRISAGQLVSALRHSGQTESTRDYVEWLPIGGLEGTVANRYVGTPAAGLTRAKTGSLTGVTSLAGVVQTADGRVLVFAVLADGMRPGQDAPRSAIDEFVAAVAACGCAG